MATVTSNEVYVSCAWAARRLKTTRYRLQALALRGEIRTQAPPDAAARYNLEDVERIAEQSKQSD